ncbi:MAG: DUF1573 domain-containing protein [Flammeovirgaceae bacterium]|nr:DUF1573 domain-containing protein [Flammeovirgaceae bacterium]
MNSKKKGMFDSSKTKTNFMKTKKTTILLAGLFIATLAIGHQYKSFDQPMTKRSAIFSWSETAFDFGKIIKDVPVAHEFTFVNTGNEALVISSVRASCGCTVTEYSKELIQPGGKGFVKATYNAAKPGAFTKTITIQANTAEEVVVLSIKGEVIE